MTRVTGIGGIFEGVEVDAKVEDSADGRFGWAMDPDGNRFEPWEPPRQKKS